jgi:hypothetical protein
MHKAGIPPKAADTLTTEIVAFSAAQSAEAQASMIAESDKAFATTTQKWGAEAQQRMEMGKRFTSALIPAEVTLDNGEKVNRQQFLERVFNSTGATGAMLEIFAAAGMGMGEHKMITNGSSGMADTSPAGAQARIAALKLDPAWSKAYLNGDQAKKAEMTRLMAQAYPQAQ